MSHRLQVLIPEALDARVKKAAQRERVSKGEWVRRAIEQALRPDGSGRTGQTDALTRLAALNGPTGDPARMIDEIASGRA